MAGINSLEFRTNMATELDKVVMQGSTVGLFEDNVMRTKFVGAKTLLVPEMELTGLGDYDRDNGFITGSITVENTPYTLTQDRAASFDIDRMDEDETGVSNLAGQILGEFVRTKVVPEVDAYTLSKIASFAATENHTITGTPDTEAYKMLKSAVRTVQDIIGYDEELAIFTDGVFQAALESSPEVERHIRLDSFSKGGVDTRVKTIDGMKLFPVPSARMKTQFVFYGGENDEWGFVPMESAQSVGFIVMPKRAASLVKKTEKLRTFEPDRNLKKDAWKLDYRLVYDVLLKSTMKNAIYTYVY